MKFTLTSLILAAAAVLPSDALASPQSPSEVNEAAVIARQRLLLRPAWKPATRTLHPISNGPLRRGHGSRQHTRAEEGKIAFRHNSASRRNAKAAPGAGAVDLSAVPIHIDYNSAVGHVNMPFPLAMHVNYHKNGHVKRDAGETESDPDQEDDWDCEEESEGDELPKPSSQSAAEGYAAAPSANPMASFVEPAPQPSSSSSFSAESWQQSPVLNGASDSAAASSSQASPSQAWSESPAAPASSEAAPVRGGVAQVPENNGSIPTPSVSPAGVAPSVPADVASSVPANAQSSQPTTSPPQDSSASTPSNKPTCTRTHIVLPGEICLGIVNYPENAGLTLDQLYSYNPSINSDCTNLSVGQTLCLSEA